MKKRVLIIVGLVSIVLVGCLLWFNQKQKNVSDEPEAVELPMMDFENDGNSLTQIESCSVLNSFGNPRLFMIISIHPASSSVVTKRAGRRQRSLRNYS